jgi:hypothetical protein
MNRPGRAAVVASLVAVCRSPCLCPLACVCRWDRSPILAASPLHTWFRDWVIVKMRNFRVLITNRCSMGIVLAGAA